MIEAGMLERNAERKGRLLLWDVPDTCSVGSRGNSVPPFSQLFLEDGTVVRFSQTLATDDADPQAGVEVRCLR